MCRRKRGAWVALALAACRGSPAPGKAAAPAAPALTAGERAFTSSEVEASRKIVAFRYPESPGAELGAYARLIEAALQAEVLAGMGHPIAEADLDAESKRIDASTRAPDELERIKRIAGDQGTYRKVFVLPTLAGRRLHFEVYPAYAPAHAAARARAEALLARALADPTAMEAAATAASGAHLDRGTLGEDGFLLDGPGRAPGTFPLPLRNGRRLLDLLARLPPGAMVPEVLDEAEAFLVVRWTGWAGDAASTSGRRRVERAVVPKRPADDYFWERASAIPVRVADPAMAARLRAEVSWMARVKLAP